ncbi:hypothetical protein CPB85DRAFT_1377091 [Mucidula mucida]|nr:hypothetical protein CPB85DRAFT_1377091 [Mucidula mucida]
MGVKGVLWPYFFRGARQNQSQYRAHCLACIDARQPDNVPIDVNMDASLMAAQPWFDAALEASSDKGSVRGDASAMLHHLVSCPNVAAAVRKGCCSRKGVRNGGKDNDGSEGDDEADAGPSRPPKRQRLEATKQMLKQTHLKVFKGINIPFSALEKAAVQAQFMRATISANLPFRWTDDPEVISLFLMMRATADEVIPERCLLSGKLLNMAANNIDQVIHESVHRKHVSISTDGWKDNSHNSVTGVHIALNQQSYLVKLVKTNKQKKDGKSYCEGSNGCIVVLCCCDNDGGSHKGRDLMPCKRPWLLFQLTLGDYFKENLIAAKYAEQATGLIGWLLNHQKVCAIFDDVQLSKTNTVLAVIVANLTRWTTHFLAFDRLMTLKPSLRQAAILQRDEIIAAQVGAEKERKEHNRLKTAAEEHINLINNADIWKGLEDVLCDIEPICYGTNINQTDHTRLDEVLLMFAGIFRYFDAHAVRSVAQGMTKRIEKRWKALDQPIFIFALILNLYEGVSRFGKNAGINAFALNSAFLELYKRVNSRPDPSIPADELAELRATKEKAVSIAFMAYLAGRGSFRDWKEHEATFSETNGKDPILVWEQFLDDESVCELAEFAIMLLDLVVNQAGMEQTFSEQKYVGAGIRNEHVRTRLVAARQKRKNHNSERVASLLEVPQYADLLDDSNGSNTDATILNRTDWRNEIKKWVEEEQAASNEDINMSSDEEGVPGTSATASRGPSKSRKVLPATLRKLFGGDGVARPLLQAEYAEEAPNDGALEGSGDDFEP